MTISTMENNYYVEKCMELGLVFHKQLTKLRPSFPIRNEGLLL